MNDFTSMLRGFYQKYRLTYLAHATNDVYAVVDCRWRRDVGSAFDYVVTFTTMFFMLDWRMTLVAIILLPLLAIATNIVVRRKHQSYKESQEASQVINNHVNERKCFWNKSGGYGERNSVVLENERRCMEEE